MHPLVDAEGQFRDLVAAEVQAPQAGEGVQALGHPRQVVAGQVHIWAWGGRVSRGPCGGLQGRQACVNPGSPSWLCGLRYKASPPGFSEKGVYAQSLRVTWCYSQSSR